MLLCVLPRSDTVGYMLHVGFNSFLYSQLSTGILAPDFFCVSSQKVFWLRETGA